MMIEASSNKLTFKEAIIRPSFFKKKFELFFDGLWLALGLLSLYSCIKEQKALIDYIQAYICFGFSISGYIRYQQYLKNPIVNKKNLVLTFINEGFFLLWFAILFIQAFGFIKF